MFMFCRKPERPRLSPGQEWVWDYPRPPRVEPVRTSLRVELGGVVAAQTLRGLRVLETSHPPTYYFPWEDVADGVLVPAEGRSWCEFKGAARYFDMAAGGLLAHQAAWSYERPSPRYAELAGRVAFYPSRVSACFVGDERAEAQEGDFYGGWITASVAGPFKGGPATLGW
jgi:uncharacterized protein (DUF427 family)